VTSATTAAIDAKANLKPFTVSSSAARLDLADRPRAPAITGIQEPM